MYDEGEEIPLHVDFFMTEEQREEDIERLARSENAMYDKREMCSEYCDKFLEHIAIMRKDLLALDSNEDALDLHEEMKGITDVMGLFRIGLDQSVMNQPTQINLSDWANLCLFRLAIVRRRVNALKIYIDKTGSAEALVKIEAFLYCIFEYLNTGEIDEYEMEAISEEEFFDLRFLLDVSTIHDPLAPKPEPRAKPPPEVRENPPPEDDPSEDDSQDAEEKETTDKEPLEASMEEEEPDKTAEDPSESGPSEPSEPSERVPEGSESSRAETTSPSTAPAESEERKAERASAKQRVAERRERRAKLTKTSGFRANPLANSASGLEILSFHKKQMQNTKSSSTGKEEGEHAEDSSKAPEGAVRSRLSLFDRMSRSSVTHRKKRSSLHSSALVTLRPKQEQAWASPMVRGAVQVLTSSNFSSQWKRRWLVLNTEQLEIYKEETCSHLVKAYAVASVSGIRMHGEDDVASEEKSSKKRKAMMEKEFSVLVDMGGDHLHLAPGSRKEQLQWIVAIRAMQASAVPPEKALAANLTHIRELYTQHYPTRATMTLDGETWSLCDGVLSCEGSDVRYDWDGLTCVPQEGEGQYTQVSVTWDGWTCSFHRKDLAPLSFRWVDCRKCFMPLLEDEVDYAPWSWRPDQLTLRTGDNPKEASTATTQTWSLSEPAAPPLALAVACFRNYLAEQPLFYESFVRVAEDPSPISERSEKRKKKKKDKKKDKKRNSTSTPASPEHEDSDPLPSSPPEEVPVADELPAETEHQEEKPEDMPEDKEEAPLESQVESAEGGGGPSEEDGSRSEEKASSPSECGEGDSAEGKSHEEEEEEENSAPHDD